MPHGALEETVATWYKSDRSKSEKKPRRMSGLQELFLELLMRTRIRVDNDVEFRKHLMTLGRLPDADRLEGTIGYLRSWLPESEKRRLEGEFGAHYLRILGPSGDDQYVWFVPGSSAEARARAAFEKRIQTMNAVAGTKKPRMIRSFDPKANVITIFPRMVAGSIPPTKQTRAVARNRSKRT